MKENEPQPRRGKRRLRIIKELVACRRYQYSAKVQRFLQDGDLELEDMERCVLSANAIQKVEIDDLGTAIDGCKYTIIGVDTQGMTFYICGKLIRNSEEEQIYFFITAHGQA